MQFTADSRRLALAISGRVILLDLIETLDSENSKRTYGADVVRSFAQHRQRNAASSRIGRAIKPLPERMVSDVNGSNVPDAHADNASSDEDDSPEESASEDWSSHVSQMVVSADGQWLATTDLRGRTHVFNLDAMKVNYLIHRLN